MSARQSLIQHKRGKCAVVSTGRVEESSKLFKMGIELQDLEFALLSFVVALFGTVFLHYNPVSCPPAFEQQSQTSV